MAQDRSLKENRKDNTATFHVGEIIIDSGAAECVMPKDFLPTLETLPAKAGVRFAAANGGEMGNFGRQLIIVPRDFSARV